MFSYLIRQSDGIRGRLLLKRLHCWDADEAARVSWARGNFSGRELDVNSKEEDQTQQGQDTSGIVECLLVLC